MVSLCDDPDLYGIAVFPGHVQRNEQKAGENSARCLRRFRSLQLYGFPANGEAYYDLPLIGDKVYMLYIFIGYFIYKYRRYIRISQKWAAAIFIGCMTGVFALTVFITQRSGEHYERVLEYGCPLIVLAGAAFFMILIRWQDCEIRLKEGQEDFLISVADVRLGSDLIHILFLDGYKKYAEPAAVSAWIAVPVLIAGIGGLSFLCITLLRRSRIGRAIT